MPEQTLQFPIRSDKLFVSALATDHVHHEETPFQIIDIYDTVVFGRILLLDGHIQLAELDESAYHESLVHVPLMGLPHAPTSALVVGGGDGGVLRELVKWPSITRIDMVEIDQAVVDASRRHLGFVSDGAFDNPRVHLKIADAFGFVKETTNQYDLIVVDATDTYEDEEGEISAPLFTDEFYQDCLRALSPHGFVVTQADNLVFCPYSLDEIEKNFQRVFPRTGSYWCLVPSFGGFSGFCWAGREEIQKKWSPPEGLRSLTKPLWEAGFAPHPFYLGR